MVKVGKLLFDAFLHYFGTNLDVELEVYKENVGTLRKYAYWGFRSVLCREHVMYRDTDN